MSMDGKISKATLLRTEVQAAAGWHKLRYTTSSGLYVGEVDFMFASEEAAKLILEDISRFLGISTIVRPTG